MTPSTPVELGWAPAAEGSRGVNPLRRGIRLVHDGPGEAPEPRVSVHVPGAETRIYLGGGGSADDESALWQRMLRSGMRIAYWPFALEPSSYDDGLRWVRREASKVAQVEVAMWDDLDARDERDLDDVDLVWVGGGNTYALLDHIRRHGWVEPLRTHVLAGGAYFGDSAGAVLAGADINVARFADPNDVGLTDTTGLGLLGRAIVRPHWIDSGPTRFEAALWTMGGDAEVLAIPEDAGLVVIDGIATNTGPGRVDVVRESDIVRVPEGASYLVHRSRR